MAGVCPECGGELVFDKIQRRFSCHGCALFLSGEEVSALRRKKTSEVSSAEDESKARYRRNQDYLEWWLTSKSEKR